MAITHHLSMLSKTALRTAVDNDGILDKEATSYNDIFDAFRLALTLVVFDT
jgi:hypothetical protein